MANFGQKISISADDIDDTFVTRFKEQISDNPLRDISNEVIKEALVHTIEFEDCGNCGGEKVVECEDCHGSSEIEVDCTECGGSGDLSDDVECPACCGSCVEAEDCTECDEGVYDCPDCDGKGEVKRES